MSVLRSHSSQGDLGFDSICTGVQHVHRADQVVRNQIFAVIAVAYETVRRGHRSVFEKCGTWNINLGEKPSVRLAPSLVWIRCCSNSRLHSVSSVQC